MTTTTTRTFRELVLEFLFLEEPTYFLPLDMVHIPGGFLERNDTRNQINDLWVSAYPITQGQWWAVAGCNIINRFIDRKPSKHKLDWNHLYKRRQFHEIDPLYDWQNLPVDNVSWADVGEFCDRLTTATELEYRLPTFNEWLYCFNSGGVYPRPAKKFYGSYKVDEYPPNPLGLYSMGGNVWEWVADNWRDDMTNDIPGEMPKHDLDGTERAVMGGCFERTPDQYVRYYGAQCPTGWLSELKGSSTVGFRVVITA